MDRWFNITQKHQNTHDKRLGRRVARLNLKHNKQTEHIQSTFIEPPPTSRDFPLSAGCPALTSLGPAVEGSLGPGLALEGGGGCVVFRVSSSSIFLIPQGATFDTVSCSNFVRLSHHRRL